MGSPLQAHATQVAKVNGVDRDPGLSHLGSFVPGFARHLAKSALGSSRGWNRLS